MPAMPAVPLHTRPLADSKHVQTPEIATVRYQAEMIAIASLPADQRWDERCRWVRRKGEAIERSQTLIVGGHRHHRCFPHPDENVTTSTLRADPTDRWQARRWRLFPRTPRPQGVVIDPSNHPP